MESIISGEKDPPCIVAETLNVKENNALQTEFPIIHQSRVEQRQLNK